MPVSRKRKLKKAKAKELRLKREFNATLPLFLRQPPKSKREKYTRYIGKDVLSMRQTFVNELSGRNENITPEQARERFWAVLRSPAERQEGESQQEYRNRQWLRRTALKFWQTCFKTRTPNHLLDVKPF